MLRWDLSCAYSYCLQASNNQLHVTMQEQHLFAISMDVYYMALSHKDWESTEFTNLIGWNRYWLRSRFSHLDRHLDRLHFAVKKLQTKAQKCSPFSFIFFSIIYGTAKKPDEKKKSEEDEHTLADLSSAHVRSQAKCQLV